MKNNIIFPQYFKSAYHISKFDLLLYAINVVRTCFCFVEETSRFGTSHSVMEKLCLICLGWLDFVAIKIIY